MRLAATEYQRCTDVFRALTPAGGSTLIVCRISNVRQMAAHMLGIVEIAASIGDLPPAAQGRPDRGRTATTTLTR